MFIQDYLALSPEDKVIIKKRQIEDERTAKEWIDTLKNIANVDEQGDKVRNISYWLGIIGIVLVVLSIISRFLEISFLPYLFIPGIILIILGFAFYYISKNFDLPGELLKETIIPILSVLREDMKPNGKVKLKLDLRGFKHRDKSDGEQDVSHYKNTITNYFYVDPWIEGKAVLADGTKLVWDIKDHVRHRVKKKYGSSGKYKGKEIKNKKKSVVTVQAGMNKKKFILPEGLKQKGEEGKIISQKHNGEQWMTIKRTFKHAEFERFIPKYFIDTVASVYMRAKPRGGNS